MCVCNLACVSTNIALAAGNFISSYEQHWSWTRRSISPTLKNSQILPSTRRRQIRIWIMVQLTKNARGTVKHLNPTSRLHRDPTIGTMREFPLAFWQTDICRRMSIMSSKWSASNWQPWLYVCFVKFMAIPFNSSPKQDEVKLWVTLTMPKYHGQSYEV